MLVIIIIVIILLYIIVCSRIINGGEVYTYKFFGAVGFLSDDEIKECFSNKGWVEPTDENPVFLYKDNFKTFDDTYRGIIGNNMYYYGLNKNRLYHKIPQHMAKQRLLTDNNLGKMRELFTGDPYIVKSIFTSKGKGNMVVTSFEEMKEAYNKLNKPMVLSDYIINPLLVDGKKFHVRYALLFYNGSRKLVKRIENTCIFAAEPYKYGDWNNKLIHDTHSMEDGINEFDYSEIEFDDKELVFAEMEKAANDITESIGRDEESKIKYTDHGFSILGIDFLITDEHKVGVASISLI